MQSLAVPLLSQACRTYLELAYPGGSESIPERIRHYLQLDPTWALDQVVPPAPIAVTVCQLIKEPPGYLFRLGCAHFPHMKLKTHRMFLRNETTWIFAVDTHDAYFLPPKDFGETEEWQNILLANKNLKERIEQAWEEQGILTLKSVLRLELESSPS